MFDSAVLVDVGALDLLLCVFTWLLYPALLLGRRSSGRGSKSKTTHTRNELNWLSKATERGVIDNVYRGRHTPCVRGWG